MDWVYNYNPVYEKGRGSRLEPITDYEQGPLIKP